MRGGGLASQKALFIEYTGPQSNLNFPFPRRAGVTVTTLLLPKSVEGIDLDISNLADASIGTPVTRNGQTLDFSGCKETTSSSNAGNLAIAFGLLASAF